MALPFRASLALILAAAAAGTACTSHSFTECPHTVVDRTFTVSIDATTACSLARPLVVPDCATLCGDPKSNNCSLDPDYLAAFYAANPATPYDAGPIQCPSLADGGTTVALSCMDFHNEGDWKHRDPTCPTGTGRRPEGLAPFDRRWGASVLGAHFAECAYLEAASVIAFGRLERELAAHGAPESLVAEAREARRDEIRHAGVMVRLARRFGGRVQRPRVVAQCGVRSLLAIALENAAEGIVGETYGALAVSWAASWAQDATVRGALASIAADECRHAELAHRVGEYLRARLTEEERREIDARRERALAQLELAVRRNPSAELRLIAGTPSADVAARLVRAMRESRLAA
jgi:hypothetical protein